MKMMPKFKFVGQISKMGVDKAGDAIKVIWIPKKYHKDIAKLESKQIRIIIDDEI